MPPSELTVDMQALELRLGMLHEDVKDMKQALGKLADAITKLALVEERQSQTNLTVNRLFTEISALRTKVGNLENKAPDAARVSQWVDRGVLFVLGAGVMAVLRKFNLY
jgi:regulator of replication initiation timing